MLFIAAEPGWKCKNKATCPFNETISLGDDKYSFRCDIPREDWEFTDDFTSVVTEFDLVCERGSLGFVSTSVIFLGFFIGGIGVSPISDKFGRRLPLFVCGALCSVFHFFSALVPAYWVFALFRAIVGFMIGAYSIPLFVLATEFSGIRHSSTAGAVVWIGYMMVKMSLVGVAYAIRDWKIFTMVTAIPGILYVAGWFFTPESVRWLLKKGRVSEARAILSKIARLNGKEMPEEELVLPNDEKKERLGDFRDLFVTARMAHITLGSWLIWLDRRKILVVSYILAAVGAIGALLLTDKAEHDKGYLAGKIFMSMFVAKFSSDIAFAVVYVYSAELFPTTMRSVGMGTSTAAARVSAFASAYAPLLLTVHRFLPFGLMAGLVVVAAIVVMTLPETYNRPTMENLSQDLKDQKQEKDENKNTRAGEDEENALL